jgi:hypothetical protein
MDNISDLDFRMWSLTPSLDQLVLRFSNGYQGEQGIDLHFMGVEYMEIVPAFLGITLSSPTEEVRRYLASRCRQHAPHAQIYVLSSEGNRYYVVAVTLLIERNYIDPDPTRLTCDPDHARIRVTSIGGLSVTTITQQHCGTRLTTPLPAASASPSTTDRTS